MPDLTDQMANAPTPAPWGVGAMGTTRMSMKPQLLAKLLQMKYAQQQDQEQEARAAMVRQQQMQDRMKEMQAQQLYGDKKMQAQQGFELMKMKMQQDAQQKAALLKTLIKQKADDQKKEQAKAMLAQMFGTPGAGFMARPPTQAPGIAEAQQGLAATQAAMRGMPGAQMVQQGVAGQQAQLAQMPQQRIIEDDEANNIFDAQKKAGVAPMLPPGFMLRSTLKDQQHQFNQQAAKAKGEQDKQNKVAADAAQHEKERQAAIAYIGPDASEEEIKSFNYASQAKGFKPISYAEKLLKERDKNAKNTAKATEKAVEGKFTNDEQIEITKAQQEAEAKAKKEADDMQAALIAGKGDATKIPPKPSEAGRAAKQAKELEIRQRRQKMAGGTETQPATAQPATDAVNSDRALAEAISSKSPEVQKDWEKAVSSSPKDRLSAFDSFLRAHPKDFTASEIEHLKVIRQELLKQSGG